MSNCLSKERPYLAIALFQKKTDYQNAQNVCILAKMHQMYKIYLSVLFI